MIFVVYFKHERKSLRRKQNVRSATDLNMTYVTLQKRCQLGNTFIPVKEKLGRREKFCVTLAQVYLTTIYIYFWIEVLWEWIVKWYHCSNIKKNILNVQSSWFIAGLRNQSVCGNYITKMLNICKQLPFWVIEAYMQMKINYLTILNYTQLVCYL